MEDEVKYFKEVVNDDEVIEDSKSVTSKAKERTVHRGAFMFSIMKEIQFDSLIDFINSGYGMNRFPTRLGITGVISLELTDRQGESEIYYSKFAKLFLNNETRLKNIILLNKNNF